MNAAFMQYARAELGQRGGLKGHNSLTRMQEHQELRPKALRCHAQIEKATWHSVLTTTMPHFVGCTG